MAATTTIRVDIETHALLSQLSELGGQSLVHTVRDAAVALRRQRFAAQVGRELEALRADVPAWAAYLADAETTSVTDGVD